MPKSKIVRSLKVRNQLLLIVKKPNQAITKMIGTQIQKKRLFKIVSLKNLLLTQRIMRMTGQLTVTDNLFKIKLIIHTTLIILRR